MEIHIKLYFFADFLEIWLKFVLHLEGNLTIQWLLERWQCRSVGPDWNISAAISWIAVILYDS